MVVSKATKQKWAAQWNDKHFVQEVERQVEAQKADPYTHSRLPYWLGLEVWGRQEGLLVLAGIEPETVDEFSPFDGEWTNAMPFSQHIAFFQMPAPEGLTLGDFEGNEEGYEDYLQEQERRRQLLTKHRKVFQGLQHKLDHSPSALGPSTPSAGYRPVQFLAWAASIGFQPDWLSWANGKRLLPDPIEPTRPPFFDADSPDYPELLHIAVHAWEHARAGAEGTPKQRVMAFLVERYPQLPAGSREAIAQVVNWKPTGGRPKKK